MENLKRLALKVVRFRFRLAKIRGVVRTSEARTE